MRTSKLIIVLLMGLLLALDSVAGEFDLSKKELGEVLSIAASIRKVQPYLSHSKYIEFAHAIYQASEKYGVESNLLVSIAQQESSFRENLPEGAAGEIGICQIRKDWLENKKFRKEFKHASLRRMHRAQYSFRYAAWILSRLNKDVGEHPLPYWTYYNSRSRGHQLNYYLAIQKNMRRINGDRVPASVSLKQIKVQPTKGKPSQVNATKKKRKLTKRKGPLLSAASLGPFPMERN